MDLYWVKQAYINCWKADWYEAFMDMSRATMYGERIMKTCDFKKKWVRRSLVASDDSKMLEAANDFKLDVTADAMKLATPQKMNQTEERKLVAY